LPGPGPRFGGELAQLWLRIHEAPERVQGIQLDPRLLGLREPRAPDRIEHPRGQHAASAIRQRHDDVGRALGRAPPDHLDVVAVERMAAVMDARDGRFVSSVVVVYRASARRISPSRSDGR
jgi:hypothetical protein